MKECQTFDEREVVWPYPANAPIRNLLIKVDKES